MKKFLIFLLQAVIILELGAQNIGINNNNPQTALDIEGQLRIRPTILAVTGASVTIPNGNAGYLTLSGTPGTDFTITLPAGDAGSFLLLENVTANVGTLNGIAKILPGKSRLLLKGNSDWILANDSESQLEKITEGTHTGWRLLGKDPNNYGDIGEGAVDLSSSISPILLGATGLNAVAMGYETMASGNYSTAMGRFPVASGNSSTAMGYFTKASGVNSTAIGSITDASGNYSTAMGYNTKALGVNSTAMGNITDASGENSTAMGYSTTAIGENSTAMGYFTKASGVNSTAIGSITDASGNYSTAMGYFTNASGTASTAMGRLSNASGNYSTAMGYSTNALSYGSLAIGRYNDTLAGSNPSSWVPTDPLLTIGNGESNFDLSNAMTVYKNGNSDLNGFTRLGKSSDNAPRIKLKKLTTTLNGSANGNIPHGLTESKILNIRVKVTNQFNSIVFDGNNIANNSFNAYVSSGSIVILGVAGNTGDIINRPATILITHEE